MYLNIFLFLGIFGSFSEIYCLDLKNPKNTTSTFFYTFDDYTDLIDNVFSALQKKITRRKKSKLKKILDKNSVFNILNKQILLPLTRKFEESSLPQETINELINTADEEMLKIIKSIFED